MEDPIAQAAQDDTEPAGDGQRRDSVERESPLGMGTMLDDGEPRAEGAEGGEEPAADGEEYALAFPEGVVADPEAVKTLNEVGREFGITGEKAQILATAATGYAARQVKAAIEGAEKRFVDMRLADRAATRKAWGSDFDAYRTEAGLGLARMEADGLLPKNFKSGDLQFLLEKEWFLNILRREHRRSAEQPGVMGDRGGREGGSPARALFPGI